MLLRRRLQLLSALLLLLLLLLVVFRWSQLRSKPAPADEQDMFQGLELVHTSSCCCGTVLC
jgi:sensor domain CHASE-containing protein